MKDNKKKEEVVGTAHCPNCAMTVNVIFGPCRCDPDCRLQTWVCHNCGNSIEL